MRYLILLILLAGCSKYNREVAQQQVTKAALTYSDIVDRYCIDKFPVRVSTDSTAYKESVKAIDSLSKKMKDDSLLSIIDRTNLEKEIAVIRERLAIPKNCDSLSEPLYRALAKEIQYSNKLQEINNQLLRAAQNIKPIHDTVESISLQAKYAVADKERGDAIGLLKEKTNELATMTKSRNKWRKEAWILRIAIALGLIGFLYSKFKKKVPIA